MIVIVDLVRWLRLRRSAHELSGFPLYAGKESSCCEDATCGYGSRELTASGKSQQLTGTGSRMSGSPFSLFGGLQKNLPQRHGDTVKMIANSKNANSEAEE